VEVDLGVLVELPFKGRIILLGSIGIYLPYKPVTSKDKVLTELHIDILGDFNFAEEYIRIDGRLRDSHIVGIPITGGFAFLLSWDKQPQFLMSVGGYHPKYKKPERFPEIPRLSAIIKRGKNLTLTCEAYLAITSNSFQVGWRADILMKYKGATVTGYYGFNALIYFKPFYFEADIGMGVLVKYKGKKLAGVDLHFMLSGPKPWTVKGRAKIRVLGIKFKIKFHVSWGGKQKPVPQIKTIDELLTEIVTELGNARSWSAKLPSRGYQSAEILRDMEENESQIVLHPAGHLEVRQTVLPLNRKINKFGHSVVKDNPSFKLTKAQIGEEETQIGRPLKEYFARGQYESLTDAEKISSKDFEAYDAGYVLGDVGGLDFGSDDLLQPVDEDSYENIVINKDLLTLDLEGEDLQTQSEYDGVSGNTPARDRPDQAYYPAEELTDFDDSQQYLLQRADGSPLTHDDGEKRFFPTQAEANIYRKEHFPGNWMDYEIVEYDQLASPVIA